MFPDKLLISLLGKQISEMHFKKEKCAKFDMLVTNS